MSSLQTRAAELRDQGRRTAYAIDYAIVSNPAKATHLHLCLGEQWSGKRLYLVDLDSHTEGQDADAAKAAFEAERPELAAKLDWHRSESNTGWHVLFESSVQIPTGKLYDQAGNHIGELLGKDSDHTPDPGNVRIPILHPGEVERLLNVWHTKSSDPKGERWADRAKLGLRWARGYTRMHITKIELRAHLKRNCGPMGAIADALFDQKEPFNRSDKFGNLVQTLMLHAHKLPGQQNTGFVERCTAVMTYAMASDAYGKADEKGYSPEKDAASLIAQIVNGDPYRDNRRWIIPFWAKSHATAAPAPQPEPEAPRPAHRPAGDRNKHLVTFRRVLEAIEPDDFGRRTYTLEQLADKMKRARCTVAPRTIQSYLKTLRDAEEIATAQIGGNGMPYAVLTRHFGDADNYQKRVETDTKPANFGDADRSTHVLVSTPQTAESTTPCIEDHQNTGAPAAELGGAPLAVEDLVARDMAIMRALYADLRPLTPEERAKNRKPKQKRFIPRKGQRIDQRYSLTNHGEAPAPTPYRPRVRLELETLPEPPAGGCPAGAQGFGAPLPAPAGAAPASLVERLRDLKTQRESAALQ